MATQTAPPAPPRKKPTAVPREGFIEQQIRQTGTKVKMVELFGTLMMLGTFVLAYLLLVAVVDHWIISLGFVGRWLALLFLVGAVGMTIYRRVIPLLFRKINPTYSARTIEKSYPSLKNSLVNFLLLRRDHVVHESVYDVIEQKAANDLTTNNADAAVDRLPLIKMGYVFAGVFAAFAIYSVASPKSSFQSVKRVIMPWAGIERPTQYEITSVEPGDLTTYQGAKVEVIATVGGSQDHTVTLIYRSDDGQVVDRQVPMTFEVGLGYQCQLSDESGNRGLQRSLRYRIAVGDPDSPDVLSPEYHITVEPAPTIVVDRLELNFPAYTKREPRTVNGAGDISAIEGTRVVVHGKANFPIVGAFMDLNVGHSNASVLPMNSEDLMATRELILRLQKDGRTPEQKNYRLRFTTKEGNASETDIVHNIQVSRDLPPEVEILTPVEDDIELRESDKQLIEIRALDPDFAIRRIKLRAISGNSDLLDKVLVEGEREGQVVAKFVFVPRQLGLKPGDRVSFRAIAEDNRMTPDGAPRPNISRTRNYSITIVKDPFAKQPQANQADDPQTKDDANGLGQDDKTPPQNASQRPQNQNTDRENPNKRQEPKTGSKSDPGQSNQDEPKNDRSKPQEQEGKGKSNDKNQGGTGGSGKGDSDQAQDGQQKGGKSTGEGTSDGSPKSQDQQSGKGSGAGGDQKDPSQDNTGNAQEGGTGEGGKPSGRRNSNGQKGQGDPQPGEGGDSTDNEDGDVFERILKRMREERQRQKDSQKQSGQRNKQEGAGNKQQGAGNKQEGAGNKQEGAGNKQEGAGNKQEGAGNKQEGAGNKQEGAGNKQEGAGNKQEGAGDKQEGAGNKQEGAGDKQEGAGNKQEGAGNKQEGAGDKQEGAGNKQEGAGNKQEGAGNKQEGAGNKQQGAGNKQQGAGNKQEGAGNKQEGAGNKQEGAGNKQQGAGNKQEGAGNKQEGAGNKQQGAGNKQEGAGNKQQGAGNKQQGAGNKQEGAGNKQEGAGNKQEGAGNKQEGAGNKQEGAGNKQEGAGNKQDGKQQGGSGNKQDSQKGKGSQKDKGGDPATPSNDRKKSSSKSGSNGDRSGDGEKGDGQKGNRQGNDTDGSSTPSDNGANSASESGKGQDAKKGGNKKKADGKTGTKGREKGDGSQSRRNQNLDKPSRDSNGSTSKKGTDSSKQGQKSSANSGRRNDDSEGGGIPRNTPLDDLGLPADIPDTEAARTEYAKMATAKVVEYLKNNQDNDQVLKDINLDRTDVQRMIKHYEGLRKSDASQQADVAEELRSLGLRPQARQGVRRTEVLRDNRGGLRDSSSSRIPKGIIDADAFDAFLRGAARSKK